MANRAVACQLVWIYPPLPALAERDGWTEWLYGWIYMSICDIIKLRFIMAPREFYYGNGKP